jgi:hypothetical protein
VRNYRHENHILAELYYNAIYSNEEEGVSDILKGDSPPPVMVNELRNKVLGCYYEHDALLSEESKAVLALALDSKFEPSVIIDFLSKAEKAHVASIEQSKSEWLAFAEECEPKLKSSIVNMVDRYENIGDSLFFKQKSSTVTLAASDAFERVIYLENAQIAPNYKAEDCLHNNLEISKTPNGYVVEFTQEGYEITEPSDFVSSITFSGLSIKIRCFNYFNRPSLMYFTPWDAIYHGLSSISDKFTALGAEYLNSKEEALRPLAGFRPLNIPVTEDDENAAMQFKLLAAEAGAIDIAALVEQYIENIGTREGSSCCRSIQKELNKAANEPLLRLLWSKLREASEEYPLRIESEIPAKELKATREQVTSYFHEQGFEGEYPSFKRLAPLRGLHLLWINEKPALKFNEKHVASCIDCFEAASGGKLTVSYSVSTVFLKENQLDLYGQLDGLSGFFVDKSRRMAKHTCFTLQNAHTRICQNPKLGVHVLRHVRVKVPSIFHKPRYRYGVLLIAFGGAVVV